MSPSKSQAVNPLMLLASACDYVEREPSDENGDQQEARVLRQFHPYAMSPHREHRGQQSRPRALNGSPSLVPNDQARDGVATQAGPSDGSRRRNGGGSREVHNLMEKNRRAQLRTSFEKLQSLVEDGSSDGKKMSNLVILQKSLRAIETLKRQETRSDRRFAREATVQEELNDRFQELRRLIEAKDPSFDVEEFLYAAAHRDGVAVNSAATSTASEGGEDREIFVDDGVDVSHGYVLGSNDRGKRSRDNSHNGDPAM